MDGWMIESDENDVLTQRQLPGERQPVKSLLVLQRRSLHIDGGNRPFTHPLMTSVDVKISIDSSTRAWDD